MNAPHVHSSLEVDWSSEAIVERRNRYYSASQRKFVPYKDPLILKRGKGQYVWDFHVGPRKQRGSRLV